MTLGRHVIGRIAALGAALLVAQLAQAQNVAPADADTILQTLCAQALKSPPTELDLERAEREASALQDRGDAKAIELACEGWAVARTRWGDGHVEAVRWVSNLGIALFTRQRTDEALQLLRQSYQRAEGLGAEAQVVARRNATVISLAHVQRQQMNDALAWSARAVQTLDAAAPPTEDSVRLRMHHATMLSMARRNDEARDLYAQLLAQVRNEPARWIPETVGILHQWAVAERRQARLDDALRINQLNIDFQRRWQPQKKLGIALAVHNQGLIKRAQARFDEAEELLREAVATSREATEPDLFQARANIRDSLSSLLVERGKPEAALDLAREAVALLAAGPEAGTAATLRPLRRLAEAQTASGDLAGALDTWRQALALIDARSDAGDTETRVLAWLSYTRAMLLLGDTAEADRAWLRAEAESAGKPAPPDERAERLRLRAAILRSQGRNDEALPLLSAADRVWAELHPPTHPRRLRVAAARCELGQGCVELAQTSVDGLPPDAVALRALALSRDARSAGRAADAEVQARHALAAAHAAADPSLLWRVHADYAQLQADAGRLFEASFFGKRALGIVQGLRENLLRGGGRSDEAYLRDKAALYRRVADWLLQQQRIGEALEVLRLLKRSEQADFNERGPQVTQALSLTTREQALQQRLDQATLAGRADAQEIRRLQALAAVQRITPAEQQRLQELLGAQAGALAQTRTQLDEALAAVRAAAMAQPPTPAAAPTSGRPSAVAGELRAWLLLAEQELVAVFATPQRQWVQRVPLSAAQPLPVAIAELQDRLQQRQPVQTQARALYDAVGRVVDEAARGAGLRRVSLWLDGPLRYLPIGLLHDGQRHLAEKLVITTSGADLASPAATARAQRPGLQLHAFGVTQPHDGLPALPAVADELCGIVDGPVRGLDVVPAGCRVLTTLRGQGPLLGQADADQRFTEAALLAAAERAPLLHIGTHFVLRPGNVSRSWLMLGDGQRLPLQRLQGLALGAPTLVTLSACDTAVPGQGADGREIDGLAATWLAKGAQQVLASLWRVDDRETARFMQRFYRQLAKTPADAGLALQRAQVESMRTGVPGNTPHWAAFTLMTRR